MVLVLSRKVNEQIVIDDRIVVTVLRIRGDTVRLGFEALKDVAVHRMELHEAIIVAILVRASRRPGCPNCHNAVSPDDTACPKCGHSFRPGQGR